jgi:serine/threonine-protein kinase
MVQGGAHAIDLEPGARIGGYYEVVGSLGSGGMAEVYEARDPVLGRTVAIKMVRDPASASWLISEASTLAELRHPGLPIIHTIGSHGDATFVVMERVHGVTLAEQLELRGALTADEVVDLLIGAADALACLHRHRLSHRDVKPENIMLEAGGRVVLLDVAVAPAGDDTVGGSPLYMAPELIRGQIPPDRWHLVDIYALGAVGCELLAGRPTFDGETLPEVIQRHLHQPPLIPTAPAPLARLLREMLAKKPGDRPSSADLVARWLRGLRRAEAHPVEPELDVLIADDDPEMRQILAACVHSVAPTATVREAEDGVEAVDAFRTRRPELLLCDLDMPRMNGLALCRLLRTTSLGDETTIIAVSASGTSHDRSMLAALGIHDYVNKHALVAHLFALLQRMQEARKRIFF